MLSDFVSIAIEFGLAVGRDFSNCFPGIHIRMEGI